VVERLPAGGDRWKLGRRVRVRVKSWRGRDLPVPSVGTAIVGSEGVGSSVAGGTLRGRRWPVRVWQR